MGFDSIITKINSCIEIEDQIWYKTGSTFNSDISSKAMTSKVSFLYTVKSLEGNKTLFKKHGKFY